MILFIALLIILAILFIIALIALCAGGYVIVVVFADLIVFLFILIGISKLLFKRRKKNK